MAEQLISESPYNEIRNIYDEEERHLLHYHLTDYFGNSDVFVKDIFTEDKGLDALIKVNGFTFGIENECLQTHWKAENINDNFCPFKYPYNAVHLFNHKVKNGINFYANKYEYNPKYHLYFQYPIIHKSVAISYSYFIHKNVQYRTVQTKNGPINFYRSFKWTDIIDINDLGLYLDLLTIKGKGRKEAVKLAKNH